MTILLYLIGLLFILGALASCAMAKSAVHEIGGLVALLIGFMLIGTGLLFDRATTIGKLLVQIRNRLPPPEPIADATPASIGYPTPTINQTRARKKNIITITVIFVLLILFSALHFYLRRPP